MWQRYYTNQKMWPFYRKLKPYLWVTSGECADATDRRSGTSLGSSEREEVRLSILQNSDVNRRSDNAWLLSSNSWRRLSINDKHNSGEACNFHIWWTDSSMLATSWERPARTPRVPGLSTTYVWLDISCTSQESTLAMMATASETPLSRAGRCASNARSLLNDISQPGTRGAQPCNTLSGI